MWLITLLLVSLFLLVLLPVFLAWALWRGHRQRRAQARRILELEQTLRQSAQSGPPELVQLVALDLFAARLEKSEMEAARKALAHAEAEKFRAQLLGKLNLNGGERQELIDALWRRLDSRLDGALGAAPWWPLPKPVPAAPRPAPPAVADMKQRAGPAASTSVEARPLQEKRPAPRVTPPARIQPADARPGRPAVPPPSAPRRARNLGGLVRFLPDREFLKNILMPFIWQNLGWFIGGFCFVSGSILLVLYTTGYYKALAVFGTLSAYSLLLVWGGYQIRRRRPELSVSGNVLMMLGTLLIPLVLAVATRLVLSGTPAQSALALALAALALGVFTYAARLASGAVERILAGEHPLLFMALGGLQLAVPLLQAWPHWWLLAALHGGLLALLGYALLRYTQGWLHALFVERRRLTWYAAGTLIYAALVSFVHLTWGARLDLPDGYAGPFLMALAGLLLYVDLQFKSWMARRSARYPWLDRFSFVLYALLVPAVLLAYPGTPAQLLTLSLGTLIYGTMLWYYLSLPPLYLALACAGGVYGLAILQHFPAAWHFLLGLPGLAGVLALQRLALRRQSAGLAVVTYRVLLGLVVGLVAWSLYHAGPGLVAMSTALAASLLSLQVLRNIAAQPLPEGVAGVLEARRGYIVVGLATLTVAYAPLLLASWPTQLSLGLSVLAGLWSGAGLAGYGGPRRAAYFTPEVLYNSALLSMAASIGLALATHGPQPWLLLGNAAVLAWLGLGLRARALIYMALVLLGAASALLKMMYFPDSVSSGRGKFLLAGGVWLVLWWLAWRARPATAAETPEDITLLWIRTARQADRAAAVAPPLELAMWLLWGLGLWRLADWLTAYWPPGPGWGISALLGALVTALLAGRGRQTWLLAPALLLAVAALLAFSPVPVTWLPGLAGVYALLLWLAVLPALDWGRLWQALGWREERAQAESTLHWTALALQIPAVLAGVPALIWPGVLPRPLWLGLAPLAAALLFFWLAGQRYRMRLHSYLFLGTLALGASLAAGVALGVPAPVWARRTEALLLLGLFSALLALLAEGLSRWPARAHLYRLPLHHYAVAIYGYVLFMALAEFSAPWPRPPADDGLLAAVFLALAAALLPVARPLDNAPRWRGGGLPLLLSLALAAAFPAWLDDPSTPLIWGYVLWGWAAYVLPPCARRWPTWAVEADFWPWLGLLMVLAGLHPLFWTQGLPDAHVLFLVSLYLLLMLGTTRQPLLAWSAALGVTASGLVFLYTRFPAADDVPHLVFAGGGLLWLNALLLAARGLRAAPQDSPRRQLAAPLYAWAVLLLCGVLLAFGLNVAPAILSGYGLDKFRGLALLGGALLALSWLHLLYDAEQAGDPGETRSWYAHALLLGLLLTLLALGNGLLSLSLSLGLWSVALALGTLPAWPAPWRALRDTAALWLPASFGAALFGLLLLPDFLGGQTLLTLAVLGGLGGLLGWRGRSANWLLGGAVLLWALLHLAWPVALPGLSWPALLPWYALQNALLAWGVFALRDVEPETEDARLAPLVELAARGAPWLAGLALLLWLVHALHFLDGLHVAPAGFGPAQLAALAAGLLLWALWLRYQPDPGARIYGAAALLGALGVYLRLTAVGLAPLSVWDTASLLAAGYALLFLQHVSASQELYRLALLMPALALLTVPLQLASAHTSLALFAGGSLYLLLPRQAAGLPVYLGLLALNAAIYLWVPGLAENSGLLQLYAVPAALSVLLMLQLHWVELRQQTRNAVRLTALSALYVSAVADVFQSPAFGIFLLALGLSLGGIVLGIALRTRIFLYAGTVSLVFNVGYQLLQFTPEDVLGKAMVLMAVGGLITAGMIGFNIQREAILQRVRIFRADLAEWE